LHQFSDFAQQKYISAIPQPLDAFLELVKHQNYFLLALKALRKLDLDKIGNA